MGVTELADPIINSARLGLRKPDPQIYHRALAILDVPPAAVLFVDDKPRNTLVARELGIECVDFTSAADLGHGAPPSQPAPRLTPPSPTAIHARLCRRSPEHRITTRRSHKARPSVRRAPDGLVSRVPRSPLPAFGRPGALLQGPIG